MFDIDDLIDDLDNDSVFEERPVDLDTFMGKGYLEQHGVTLSHHQKEMIEHMTQVYKFESLVYLYGKKTAETFWKKTVREVICMLGKGSGKDYCAEIACAYAVYKLLCLKDPALYFGKPPGDSIDIINVAQNAEQAKNVFFKGFKRMIKNSPWFQGKFEARMRDVSFDKNITVYSAHSEAEVFEGYNTFLVILDEIAGFEHFQQGDEDDGRSPAQAIYDMYNASITSRFGSNGKIVLLSFPRQKGDFIESRYREVVGEVVSHPMSHTFVFNPDLPEDTPGNSFTIEWTIDEIISYKKRSGIWALRRPSWDVNPTKNIDEYIDEFYEDVSKALGKFAAEPQESVGGFFQDHEKIDEFSNFGNGVDEYGVFYESFQPDPDKRYFVHVDLARKHDRCVVAMAHVAGWRRARTSMGDDVVPVIKVDLVRYWTPSQSRQVDFMEVRDFVMSVSRRGFNIRKITFDQWQSDDMIKFFNRAGIESDVLSVGLQHYMDLKLVIMEGRGEAPKNEVLRRELKQLFITKNGKNVDHPRTKDGSKDISDTVAGAVYNAISLTPKEINLEFTIMDQDDFRRPEPQPESRGIIDPPRKSETRRIPEDIAEFIGLI